MPTSVMAGVFIRRDPIDQAPVLFEIPRSGTQYPMAFRAMAALSDLQKSVSMFVEDCCRDVPEEGATWLLASFPNAFIDPNRHELDIEPEQLDGPWKVELAPSPLAARGLGLIPTVCARTVPIYEGKLKVSDVEARLANFYWPYHHEVARLLNGFRERAGVALHMSCHSMFDVIPAGPDAGKRRSDFDLGDRNGTTCSPDVTHAVAEALRDRGYTVTVNKYFAGAEAVRKHGNPEAGIHSLQIEINRKLYMDEATCTPIDRRAEVQNDLRGLARRLAEISRDLVQ